ncbi:MAG: outer membrane lipoprotein-sorting protein [Nitrospinota bacterium]|nr:outer membrane lipoprotein-sorting protein [Nitrospinota bacterium]
MDKNLWANTKFIDGRLIIDNGRRIRTLSMESWMEGVTKSYSYYKAPARERGTKMLKLDRKLWMYTPHTDRKILIAGHLLRQSMMGSDLSYEDMMEDEKISEAYTGRIDGEEEMEGMKTLVMTLQAKRKTKTYQMLKIWVDPIKKIVLKEEAYAKSGKLLKLIHFKEYRKVDNRLFPRKMIFRDMLKENTKTTYMFDEIRFDVDIPSKYFSQSILKR